MKLKVYIIEMLCPECGGEVEVTKDNEYYCKECGLVMEKLEMIPTRETCESRDPSPNWQRNLRQTERHSWEASNGHLVDLRVVK